MLRCISVDHKWWDFKPGASVTAMVRVRALNNSRVRVEAMARVWESVMAGAKVRAGARGKAVVWLKVEVRARLRNVAKVVMGQGYKWGYS